VTFGADIAVVFNVGLHILPALGRSVDCMFPAHEKYRLSFSENNHIFACHAERPRVRYRSVPERRMRDYINVLFYINLFILW